MLIAALAISFFASLASASTSSTLSTSSIPSISPPASSTSVLDRESTALLHAMILGQAPPQSSTSPGLDPLADWRAYLAALEISDAAAREKALRAVYGRTRSPLVRMTVLRAISENPQHQGRQALFIRRYGFYANWFNRLVFSAGRLVQGNLQVLAQLAVDGVNDLFGAREADANTRRAYDMLRRSQSRGGGPAMDPRDLARLERTVNEALAESDLDMARWALKAGDPEAAAFYATQAAELRPDWTKAASLRLKAESEVARLRREQIASTQVGYPDRTPPVEPATPELLRAILAGDPIDAKQYPARERLLAEALDARTSPTVGGSAAMRPWQALLRRDPAPDTPAHRWLAALVYDPRANVDQRLADARSAHRANLLRFIFIGPERPRERFYKTASWMTTAWDVMSNIGVFYIFDVAIRAGQAAWARPVPAEELLDAQAAWLRQAPDAKNREARKLAENLHKIYMELNRYEDARAVLQAAGLLDPSRARRINKAQASNLLETARRTPEGPDRRAMVMRIESLDPGSSTARKAAALARDEKKNAELQKLDLDWATLSRWTGQQPPCGLPGERAWFDGSLVGGEVARDGLEFERRQGETVTTLRYPVNTYTGQRVYQVRLEEKNLPPAVRQWFTLAAGQGAAAAQTIKELRRLPIPLALEGGAGPSGVDFYPRLLPIQSKPGEIELYR